MSNWKYARRPWGVAALCALTLSYSACASRMAMVDDRGQAITAQEVAAKKTNKNFWLYTLGGGALSFGASFFLGSMVERNAESESRTALWAITGAGTVAGTILFAHTGRVRDFNQAVETVKDERQGVLKKGIETEKQKQDRITEERRKLEEDRKKQEVEREELLKKIRDKQSKEQKP